MKCMCYFHSVMVFFQDESNWRSKYIDNNSSYTWIKMNVFFTRSTVANEVYSACIGVCCCFHFTYRRLFELWRRIVWVEAIVINKMSAFDAVMSVCVESNGFVFVIFRLLFETFICFSFILKLVKVDELSLLVNEFINKVQFMKKEQFHFDFEHHNIFSLFDLWITICCMTKVTKKLTFFIASLYFILFSWKRSINIYYY